MLQDEVIRLLREKWPNPTMLAEELYAILSSIALPTQLGATTISSPPGATVPSLTINPGPGLPGIVINRPDDPNNPITIGPDTLNLGNVPIVQNDPGTGTIDLPGLPAFQGSPIQISLGSTSLDGSYNLGGRQKQPTVPPGQQQLQPQQPPQAQGAAGTVVSGSGSAYLVQLVTGGDPVAATQLQIDPSETIPAGTACILAKIGKFYYMQVPVWM